MWSDWKERIKTVKPEVPKRLLWDVDWKTFDVQRGRSILAERVAERGSLDDYYTLFALYGGKKGVKDIYKNEVGSLSSRSLAFICAAFGLKKEEMKCYIQQRSKNVFCK